MSKRPRPDQVQPGDRANLSTINRAALAEHLCLMRVKRKSDGSYVTLLCAAQREESGDVTMVPMAELFQGNPYDLYDPPA